MEPLGTDQPVIKFRFEPVQQLPGQGEVGLWIAAPVGDEPGRLVTGQDAEVRSGVAAAEFAAQPGGRSPSRDR
jgi:hypothetical protein